MSTENEFMVYWNKLKEPPKDATKIIKAGRLSGKSDINPQWRFEVMTETFGPVGIGWKYTIDKLWTDTVGDEVIAHALVSLYIRQGNDWSEAIPGIGGNMLAEQESKGLHVNDEGYKMAVTDALSVAMKALGVAATVYRGLFDSKYGKQQGDDLADEGRRLVAVPRESTTDDPDGFIIRFGKYNGKTLHQIAGKKDEGGGGDRGYLHFLLDDIEKQAKPDARNLNLKAVLEAWFAKHPHEDEPK